MTVISIQTKVLGKLFTAIYRWSRPIYGQTLKLIFGTVVIRQLRPKFKFPAKIEMAFFQIHIRHQMMI